jgi:hypothetical protein
LWRLFLPLGHAERGLRLGRLQRGLNHSLVEPRSSLLELLLLQNE